MQNQNFIYLQFSGWAALSVVWFVTSQSDIFWVLKLSFAL